MRSEASQPAQQLQSVCQRYCLPSAAWNAINSSQIAWLSQKEGLRHGWPVAAPADDQAERAAAQQRLEAVLFLAREPLNSRKLSHYANLADATEARTLIRQLNERYDRRGRAFRIVEVAGGYQLLTRPQFAAWLRRLEHTPSEVRLSAPALETLAVIAYRQPVGRADIEAIRGVNCGEIIRQLMDRDLVRIGGRSQELGRPYLYATTKRFLEICGLSSLEDLPRADVVRQALVPQAGLAEKESRVVSEQSIDERSEEDHNVSVTTLAALTWEEEERHSRTAAPLGAPVLAKDEDDDEFDDDLEDEDDELDDDEEDLDDEEDDLDDEDDDDFDDDDEWEEVEDDEEFEEEDELEEEDEDWDDEDDDLDEEEEDEDWEDV